MMVWLLKYNWSYLVQIEEIKILGKRTKNIPFEINTNQEIREDLRLQYRYLDLRNERLQNNLKLRAQVLQFLRNQMQVLYSYS